MSTRGRGSHPLLEGSEVDWHSRRQRKRKPSSQMRTWAELAAQSSREQASSDDAPANLERVIGNGASGRESERGRGTFLLLSFVTEPKSNEVTKPFFFFFPSLSVENVSLWSLSASLSRTCPSKDRDKKRSSRSLVLSYFVVLSCFSSRSLSLFFFFSPPRPAAVRRCLGPLLCQNRKISKEKTSIFTTCPRSPGRTRRTPRR